jgi:hypothetical protein
VRHTWYARFTGLGYYDAGISGDGRLRAEVSKMREIVTAALKINLVVPAGMATRATLA